jgi:hypothetical protein
MSTTPNRQNLALSRLYFIRSIGYLGVGFPLVLLFGKMLFDGWGMLDSISAYYYGGAMSPVFVSGLVALAILLLCYHYERIDTVASIAAGICAIGVANFPTAPDSGASRQQILIGWVHYGFAAVLFIVFAYFSLVLFRKPAGLFTKVPPPNMTHRKHQRNHVYFWCGVTIIGCILLLLVITRLPEDSGFKALHPVFWLETLAIWSFGFAWIVKGEVLMKDEGSSPDTIQYGIGLVKRWARQVAPARKPVAPAQKP